MNITVNDLDSNLSLNQQAMQSVLGGWGSWSSWSNTASSASTSVSSRIMLSGNKFIQTQTRRGTRIIEQKRRRSETIFTGGF